MADRYPAEVRLKAGEADTKGRGEGRCRSCQQKILWATTVAGKAIPFDDLELSGFLSDDGTVETVSADTVHFRTCPNADDFRRR